MPQYDVVIVGAGVIGHSIAFKIKQARPGWNIVVLGDPMHSLVASRAAAGMLAPYCECREANRFFRFCRESLDKYPRFIEEVSAVSGKDVFLSDAGSIMPEKSLGDQWDERLQFFKSENVPHAVWSPAEVKERLPHLSPDVGACIWVGEAQINNRQLHDALVAASAKLGVMVETASVTGFRRDNSEVYAAVTDTGEILGKRFVLAAGSWSQQLGTVLGVSMPVRPIKGQMCRVDVDEVKLAYTIHGMCTYIAPWRQGNGFVLGSTMEDKGFDGLIQDDVIQAIIDRAAAILPAIQDALLIETWAGLRPAAEDRMPVMGASSKFGNLFYSTGHFRNGILQTPNQADYMAGIVTGDVPELIADFDPARYDM